MHLNMLCFLTGALFAGSVLAGRLHKQTKLPVAKEANPNAIAQAIDSISEYTQTLGDTISERPMNIIKAAVVQKECWGVAKTIKQGIEATKQSHPLNMSQGFKVLLATENLVSAVNKTTTAVIEAHDIFAFLLSVPLIPFIPHMDVIVLKKLEEAESTFGLIGDHVLLKVPDAGREDIRDRLEKIAHSFDMAIAVYQNEEAMAEEMALKAEPSIDTKTAVPFTA